MPPAVNVATCNRQQRPKIYHIELDAIDLGQLLDGLEVRAESSERTVRYLRAETIAGDDRFLIEECSKPEEPTTSPHITARSFVPSTDKWRPSDDVEQVFHP